MERPDKAFYALVPIYAATSFYFGTWYAAIPTVESMRGISDGQLGDFMSLAIVGAVPCLLISPFILDSLGSSTTIILSFIIMSLGVTLMGVNASAALFGVAMGIFGFGTIILYAAQFAQAALVEKTHKRQSTGVLNAMQCLGGILGGIVGGSLLDYTNLAVWQELLASGCVQFGVVLLCSFWLFSFAEERVILADGGENRE